MEPELTELERLKQENKELRLENAEYEAACEILQQKLKALQEELDYFAEVGGM